MARGAAAAWALLALALAAARELDPAACAPRFDVQRDKIIRTEESRDMGARYLSELDVGARAECLRLCCETDACDVFVYEEKGPGSCYLFNCGPPEDFRCKFTAHGNFSSGVLALSRRLAELEDQERLALHERELARLRAPAGTGSPPSTPPARAAPPAPAPPPPPPPALHADKPTSSACSRYQFACRAGGECVAVYNACDGVPQCADGSDEAPELGCPPRAAPAPATAPAPSPTKPSINQDVQESEEGGAAAVARWPHRLAQAQPRRTYDEGAAPHIFSHKGGLVQEEGALPFAPFDPAAGWPRRAWPQPQPQPPPQSLDAQPLGIEGMTSERGWGGAGISARGWAATADGGAPGWGATPEGGTRAGGAAPAPHRAWAVPPHSDVQEFPEYAGARTMPEVPAFAAPPHALRDAAKKGPAREPAPAPAATPPPRLRNHTQHNTHYDTSPAPSTPRGEPRRAPAAHQHYTDEHDALAERAPAAVLLLVLGVAMTAAACGTALCRAGRGRAGRAGRARGRAPLAHDADYLVNGMYL